MVKKILVVDDEPDICNFVKNFFEERGFEVLTALGGKQALEMAENEGPLIVLLDIRMPQMDGIETLRHIKSKRPSDRVIMVTCIDDLDKMDEAKRCGAGSYITKPLILNELIKTVMAAQSDS